VASGQWRFFEGIHLREFLPGYVCYSPAFQWLVTAITRRLPKYPRRSGCGPLFSRPACRMLFATASIGRGLRLALRRSELEP